MYERTLQSALRFLASTPGTSAPVRELWASVRKEARAASFEQCSLADFAALIDADSRFDIVGNGFDPESSEDEAQNPEERALYELGFRPTCSVRLRATVEGEDTEEMPSLIHRHLSETRPVAAKHPTGPHRAPRKLKKGKSTNHQSHRRLGGRKIAH